MEKKRQNTKEDFTLTHKTIISKNATYPKIYLLSQISNSKSVSNINYLIEVILTIKIWYKQFFSYLNKDIFLIGSYIRNNTKV